jgi:hypothetical protein
VVLELLVEQCEPAVPECKVEVFPNPTSGPLHVEWCELQCGEYHIQVKDAVTGCVVFCSTGRHHEGENAVCLDLSGLKDGFYVLYLNASEVDHTERIEIKH